MARTDSSLQLILLKMADSHQLWTSFIMLAPSVECHEKWIKKFYVIISLAELCATEPV